MNELQAKARDLAFLFMEKSESQYDVHKAKDCMLAAREAITIVIMIEQEIRAHEAANPMQYINPMDTVF